MKVWHCVPCPAVVKNLIVSELTSYSYQHHDTSMDVTTFKKKNPHSPSGKTKITLYKYKVTLFLELFFRFAEPGFFLTRA